jgi:protease IV
MSTHPGPVPSSPAPSRGLPVLGCAFAASVVGNLLAGMLILILCLSLLFRSAGDSTVPTPLTEKFVAGSKSASDKVAVVAVEGVIMEGVLDHVHRQLEQAGKDPTVKATVLRVNSPGGSITASDDLHRRILQLKNGEADQDIHARPLVVSMSSVAASGGYYIAVPAQKIFAERTTLTGSIGVYASFPNVKELAAKVGASMQTIKAGQIKDAGSMFRDMTPTELQVTQDMVDDAYLQFLGVVEQGRPALTRKKMLDRFTVTPLRPDPKAKGDDTGPYTRYRADGGIFSAAKAKELGLIDDVGTLEEAVKAAAALAKLDSYRAVRYKKQTSFTDLLLNMKTPASLPSGTGLDHQLLRGLFTPRMWYLAPGHEAAALLATSPE